MRAVGNLAALVFLKAYQNPTEAVDE